MKNWKTLEPDRIKLLNKHFTPGRGGKKIDKVVIHHNAGVLSIDQIWQVWQDRAASAHYQITTTGEIGQLVWDRDTAWHAANQHINQTSIGLEFSNSAGANVDWPIADRTIEEGAHLVAAICKYYKLGRPQVGKNVRFHREFTSTSCPYHLAPGGKYHATLMGRAQYWYDQMTGKAPAKSTGGSSVTMNAVDQVNAHTKAFISGYLGPQIDALQEVWRQLRGPQGKGWPQLGQNERGQNLTLVDAVAALRVDVAELRKIIEEKGTK